MQPHNDNSPQNVEPKSTLDTIEEAVKGEDQPMAKSHPNAISGLVFLTYPILIIVMLLGAFVLLAIFGQ